ncbi:hypothetical protein [Adhaeribacter pallidiroseus]|uniref:Uncharacterized protein n=1 Tax=Adhaeribacter pallidiroseus TaxID=2072847 RepID=A0A369QRL5_9BACT|nr:hypothetical protein [Adhaeribacter pallidiroseus]RDC65459.1 hypothetical protein AHMF7616_04089 [Adhaeribacter pallidiroseus]
MKRLKAAIIFGTKPNFDKDAFMYFILYVNKIQSTYEFCFPDVSSYPFEKEVVDYNTSPQKVNEFVKENSIVADIFISIITSSFNNNYFFYADYHQPSIITTDIWDRHLSPPSLFEYLLHSIYSCLIYTQVLPNDTTLTNKQLLIKLDSHNDTRGCIADFTRQKYDDRIDIILGYICEEHTNDIKQFYGEGYLNDLQYVISRKWIGSIEEKESAAYNLKHIYKFDINKDSGFNKTLWDKIKAKFYEIPGSLIAEIIKIILTAFLTYYLIKLGFIDKE